jgi:hypothetical protein
MYVCLSDVSPPVSHNGFLLNLVMGFIQKAARRNFGSHRYYLTYTYPLKPKFM